jgi:hypothetical protein
MKFSFYTKEESLDFNICSWYTESITPSLVFVIKFSLTQWIIKEDYVATFCEYYTRSRIEDYLECGAGNIYVSHPSLSNKNIRISAPGR